jgi:hypothetical protein
MLQARVLCPHGDASNRAAGLTYHIADLFVPELRNCAAPPPPGAAGGEPPLAGRRHKAAAPAPAAAVAGGKRARGDAGQVPAAAVEALLAPFVEALRVLPEKAAVLRIRWGWGGV